MNFNIKVNRIDESFIKRNEKHLTDMFNRWLKESKEAVFSMPNDTKEERDNRDRVISAVQFLEVILGTIRIVNTPEPKQEDNKDFV